ncbi:hypothetical protein [Methylobacterium planeticum]|uniref:Uncharacterized protein n=1 Tax=Methylobacterium planeticum TaxID=2615211 RepID=A0A6N6MKM8_9HYPH|nr:hypothetical protein [Methylobacterium planeticum]KAB1071755.1 hypothetical protein F6X51_18260 [Methylobacterium planeticum]
MAPGYVIAIGLELAGFAGLGLGLVLMRAERRAKAVGLKTFLKSGNPVSAGPISPGKAQISGRRAMPPRTLAARPATAHRPATVQAAASRQDSEALKALRRAYARGAGARPA